MNRLDEELSRLKQMTSLRGKSNDCHDPETGQFCSDGGGESGGGDSSAPLELTETSWETFSQLPDLKGVSSKQENYADFKRRQSVAHFWNNSLRRSQRTVATWKTVREEVSKETSAKWWLDHTGPLIWYPVGQAILYRVDPTSSDLDPNYQYTER